jgi:flagellar biosynthesis GTPase FlhF
VPEVHSAPTDTASESEPLGAVIAAPDSSSEEDFAGGDAYVAAPRGGSIDEDGSVDMVAAPDTDSDEDYLPPEVAEAKARVEEAQARAEAEALARAAEMAKARAEEAARIEAEARAEAQAQVESQARAEAQARAAAEAEAEARANEAAAEEAREVRAAQEAQRAQEEAARDQAQAQQTQADARMAGTHAQSEAMTPADVGIEHGARAAGPAFDSAARSEARKLLQSLQFASVNAPELRIADVETLVQEHHNLARLLEALVKETGLRGGDADMF